MASGGIHIRRQHVLVVGGAVALWLARWTPSGTAQVRAGLCSWARHFTFTVPLSTSPSC